MESVIFDGREYMKASVLAERFGYTQDYLGQLCRGKKVDARLVGRAWYINLDSLQAHRKSRYKSEKQQEDTSVPLVEDNTPKPHFLSRVDVEPVLKKKTVKILKNKDGKLREYPVKYENDDYSLIPKISREAVHKTIAVLPAEAEDVRVKATKESVHVTAFKAEPLPEVYLKGKLRISGIPEITEEVATDGYNEEPPHSEMTAAKPKLVTVESEDTPQTEVINLKKPLKIKLYRNNQAQSLEPKEDKLSFVANPVRPDLLRPVPLTVKSPKLPRDHMNGQILVKNIEKSSLPVPTLNKEATKSSNEKIPYATTKAFISLAAGLVLSATILASSVEGKSTDRGFVMEWNFSAEQAQEMIVLAIQKYL